MKTSVRCPHCQEFITIQGGTTARIVWFTIRIRAAEKTGAQLTCSNCAETFLYRHKQQEESEKRTKSSG